MITKGGDLGDTSSDVQLAELSCSSTAVIRCHRLLLAMSCDTTAGPSAALLREGGGGPSKHKTRDKALKLKH